MLENFAEHVIMKKNLLLRPRTNRIISFRGTPGGRVSIRVTSRRLLTGLGDVEEPLDDEPNSPFRIIAELPELRLTSSDNQPERRRSPINRLERAHATTTLAEEVVVRPLGRAGDGEDTTPLIINPADPFLIRGRFGENFVIGPVIPDPDPPPPLPPMDIRVRVAVRDGATLLDENVSVTFPFQTNLNQVPFPGHDIIDVMFTNLNDFPIRLSTFLNVQNEFTLSTKLVDESLITRVFNNTLLALAPTLHIKDGKINIFFPEIHSKLKIEPVEFDIGNDFDGTATISPVSVDLMSHEEAITIAVQSFEKEVRDWKPPPEDDDPPPIPRPPVPPDFEARTVEAYFTGSFDILFNNMGLRKEQWSEALKRNHLLNKPPNFTPERDAVALHFNLGLTQLAVENTFIEVTVESITVDLYMVLNNGSLLVSHPVPSLHDDSVRTGMITPRYGIAVNVRDFEIDAQNIDIPGGIITAPLEFFINSITEIFAEIIELFKEGSIRKKILGKVMGFLNGSKAQLGELVTETVKEIGNRNHIFRNLYTENQNWQIMMLDPSQLAVPFVADDGIDHRLDVILQGDPDLEPVDPIDGPMPADALTKLSRVKHLVFLMMENRSFDHMLGYLSHPSHGNRQDIEGLDGREVSLGGSFTESRATPQPVNGTIFKPDPGHGIKSVAKQINKGAMDGFVSEFARRLEEKGIPSNGTLNDPERILHFLTDPQVNIYHGISELDLILDHWFCSIPGGTWPNRAVYYSGITPTLDNSGFFDEIGYLTDITLFDLMDHKDVDWIYYESDVTLLRFYEKYRINSTQIRPIDEFWLLTENDKLPKVTFIDPNFEDVPGAPSTGNDDHPPANVRAGQDLIHDILEKLQQLDEWSETMLVITYDEHGGFADHIPPPGTPMSDFPPAPDGTPGIPLSHPDAHNWGPRIPALVVSDLVKKRDVGSRIYNHTSVFRTIVERFMPDLRNSPILPETVRRARHLGELINTFPEVLPKQRDLPPKVLAKRFRPDLIIRDLSHDNDDYRDPEDFRYLIRNLGNPIKTDK